MNQRAIDFVKAFVAGVTHDFGTPLHAIKNAVELMQDGMAGPLTDRQAEYLLMISNSTIQLTSFVHIRGSSR